MLVGSDTLNRPLTLTQALNPDPNPNADPNPSPEPTLCRSDILMIAAGILSACLDRQRQVRLTVTITLTRTLTANPCPNPGPEPDPNPSPSPSPDPDPDPNPNQVADDALLLRGLVHLLRDHAVHHQRPPHDEP